MRFLTRTMILIVVFSLVTISPAMDQARPEGKIQTFTISGNAGVPGVTMKGLPVEPVTDERGYYSVTVNSDWLGTVIPVKKGYKFSPPQRAYLTQIKDLTNQDYVPEFTTYKISGSVGLPGVTMMGLPDEPVTDENGFYIVTVENGWVGMVEPRKEGYRFEPRSKLYNVIKTDLNNQNYIPRQLSQAEWQFDSGRWEPARVSADGRGSRRGRSTTGFQPADTRKVLVVPSSEVKAQDLAEIIEDMQIMSHILDERFKETRRVQGVFTDFGDFFGRDNRQTEATYLQGFGVLFSMEVNFAFSPAPKQPQQIEQTAEPADSTWEKARQQMLSPGTYKGAGQPDSAEEYDSRMVEELKRDLIATLKHAANIRGLWPDELIILTVIGSGRQGGGFGGGGFMMGGMGGMYGGTSSGGMMGGMGGGMMGGGMGGGMMGGMGAMGGMGGFSEPGVFSEMGVSPATVLTIRAKKSDVDAFAKGDQDYEQFRQKVQIFTY